MNELAVQQNNGTAVASIPEMNNIVNVNELKQRANSVRLVKREIMQEGVHYGKIEGCGDKPTLLKNGAELLCMAFKLAPSIELKITDMGNGHREYTVTTLLAMIGSGEMVSSGIGSCSTMESKYRYRGCEKEFTNKPVPSNYWDLKKTDPKKAKELLGGNDFIAAKNDEGKWVICKKGCKTENPDIADTYNTVLKMASKRSLIDAVLKATGGSCEFTQDIEDFKITETDYTIIEDDKRKTNETKNKNQQTQNAVSKDKIAKFQAWADDQKQRVGEQAFENVLNNHGGLDSIMENTAKLKSFTKDIEAIPNAEQPQVFNENEEVPF